MQCKSKFANKGAAVAVWICMYLFLWISLDLLYGFVSLDLFVFANKGAAATVWIRCRRFLREKWWEGVARVC